MCPGTAPGVGAASPRGPARRCPGARRAPGEPFSPSGGEKAAGGVGPGLASPVVFPGFLLTQG